MFDHENHTITLVTMNEDQIKPRILKTSVQLVNTDGVKLDTS